MTPKVVALCGVRRCGKDTAAKYLSEHYNLQHVKIAQRLKDALSIIFGFTADQLESGKKDVLDARWNITPRQVMQFFGTEMMQFKLQELMPSIGRNFWIKRLAEDIAISHRCFVISDLRFCHEENVLRTAFPDAKIIRIINNHNRNRNQNDSIDDHSSEKEVDMLHPDVIIENNGSIEELHDSLKSTMQRFIC